eukprot:scaffold575_cov186-Amphora_coffeaeformis.AAC.15
MGYINREQATTRKVIGHHTEVITDILSRSFLGSGSHHGQQFVINNISIIEYDSYGSRNQKNSWLA